MCSMVKTEELYYQDAYLKEFEGKVLSCEKGKGDSFLVVLDRTAFFPEQGGQSSDIGSISDAVVTHDNNSCHRQRAACGRVRKGLN